MTEKVNSIVEPAPEFLSLDPRNIQLETLTSLIVTGVLGFGWFVTSSISFFVNGLGTVTYSLLGAGLLLLPLLYWLSFFMPKLSHRMTSWRLDQNGLEIRRGVIWRHRISVPVARVQHADVSQGPFQRRYGLGTLTVHTAGTQNASVALEGLTHDLALEMRDKTVRQQRAVDVV